MFSGLNKFLKIILPKRLFYRALIIVAAPTIILQLIITIVFYDSIWIKANKNTTRSLVAQLKTIEEVYQNDKKNLDFFTDSYKNNFNFEIGVNQNEFPNITGERKFSPMDRSLRRELKSTFGNNNYWFSTSKFKNAVRRFCDPYSAFSRRQDRSILIQRHIWAANTKPRVMSRGNNPNYRYKPARAENSLSGTNNSVISAISREHQQSDVTYPKYSKQLCAIFAGSLIQ